MTWSLLWSGMLTLLMYLTAIVVATDDSEVKSIPLRTHSLQTPYLDSQLQSRWWDFGLDTIIRTDKYIRLTGEVPSRAGWIYSRVPLTATNWEMEIEFKISGEHHLYGDGMAIWLTKDHGQGGPVFGGKDMFEGLGIFIDTYKNNRPGVIFPYIMAMHGDGQTRYEKETDGKGNELAGCPTGYVRNNHNPTKLRITYYSGKSLTVDLQHEPDKWENCFRLDSIKLPMNPYLGFTAETGELVDNHDIISVETRNLYMPDAGNSRPNPNTRNSRGYKDESKKRTSWTWTFFKFILFGFIVAGSYIGYTAWRTHKNRHRF